MLNYEKCQNSYGRIQFPPMTAIERRVAINALKDAEAIADGILWLKNAVVRLVSKLSVLPAGFKHSFKH